jgi:predicted RNA-binding protein Jag
METMLVDVFNIDDPSDPMTDAMIETEEAIGRVINGAADAVELKPQATFVRRLQHQMAERYNLHSESRGKEPHRRVKISR